MYTEKSSTKRIYKDKQARYGGNKRGKTVKFESTVEEVNIMKSHDEPIPRKKKGRSHNKNPIVTRPTQTHQRMDAIMGLKV